MLNESALTGAALPDVFGFAQAARERDTIRSQVGGTR
jgi:hypothetical protein